MSKVKSKPNKDMTVLMKLKIDEIEIPQLLMRQVVDEKKIGELAESMAEVGLINAISVLREKESFVLVTGWRRLQAARRLGWQTIDARVIVEQKVSRAAFTLHENFAREDVNALDEAVWVKTYMDEENITAKECARKLRRSDSWVRERIAIAGYRGAIRQGLQEGKFGVAIARELSACSDDNQIRAWISYGTEVGWSQKTAKEWVRVWKLKQERPNANPESEIENWSGIEESAADPICDLCEKPASATEVRWPRVHKRCFALVKKAYSDMLASETISSPN